MSVLTKLACMQNRRDEEPNKNLARELAERKDTGGIKEIAENLGNKDKNIQSDCASVLEEIGRCYNWGGFDQLLEHYRIERLRIKRRPKIGQR